MILQKRDEEQIASLCNQNNYLMAKVTSNNNDTADLKAAIKALQSAVKTLDNEENRPPPRTLDRRNFDKLKKPEHYFYFWTHGRTGHRKQT